MSKKSNKPDVFQIMPNFKLIMASFYNIMAHRDIFYPKVAPRWKFEFETPCLEYQNRG